MTGPADAQPMLHPGVPGLRRNTLIRPRPGSVRAEIEDDYHHFEVELVHDGHRIERVETAAPRFPWTTCPAAGPFLAGRLAGTALADAPTFDAQLSHCTHLFDLALLAARHALDEHDTLLQAFVSDPDAGRMRAEFHRNGRCDLAWDLQDGVIEPPGEPAGESLRRLKHWLPTRPESEHEAAIYLRRAVFISGGRLIDRTRVRIASSFTAQAGACYTFAPERAADSRSIPSSQRDFTGADDAPLAARLAS